MQLIDSSEGPDALLSKRTRVGFKPVTSWLQTSGTNHYTMAAPLKLLELPSNKNYPDEGNVI